MEQTLENTIAILAATPSTVNSLLRNLPAAWTTANEGDASWTPIEVVAHLIRTDHINWMPRVRHILEFGESQPFPPFQRISGAEQLRDLSLPQLLDTFTAQREEKLLELNSLALQAGDMTRRGIHPELGPVILSNLLATWATHDLTHTHQIVRVLAVQYREAVGPWTKYLGVLHCNGHSVRD